MKIIPLFILLIVSFCAQTSEMHDKAKEGIQHAEKLKSESQGEALNPKSVDLTIDIPGYNHDVCSAKLEDGDLKQAQSVASHDEHAKHIYDLHTKKDTSIKIDPINDPLIRDSDELLKDPMKAIVGESVEVTEDVEETIYEEVKCEEPGEPFPKVCYREYKPTFVEEEAILTEKVNIDLYGAWKDKNQFSVLITLYAYFKNYPQERVLGTDHLKLLKRVQSPNFKSQTSPVFKYENTYLDDHFPVWDQRDSLTRKHLNFDFENLLEVKFLSSHGPYMYEYDWGWYADYQYGLYEFKYKDKKKTPKDNWEDNCNYLEDLVDKDLCTYVSSECIEPNETRVIDDVSIFKECWKEKRTYSCVTPFKSDGKCSNLRAQGCFQINSKCTQYKKGICVKYEQTFKCPISKKLKVTKINSGKAPFCIGGDCVTPSYTPNTEMMEAISRLEVLRKIQEDLRADAVKIFDGKNPQKCSKYIVNFKDCCMKTKGWGVSAHLSQCSAEEKILSKNRSKNLCVFVGTYCAEKVLGKCIRKKSSFCCFGSKLARIIHEQGRPQLGISWGDAKHPQCRGFSQEEIANLDFSKFDLSELYEELMSRYKEKDLSSYVSQKPNLLQNIDTQIKLIQKELSLPKDKKPEREM